MGSLLVGMISMIAVVFMSVKKEEWGLYVNLHAIVIVLGGTFAVLAASNPNDVLKRLFSSITDLFQPSRNILEHWKEFEELNKTKSIRSKSKNELINFAASLWEVGVSSEMFIPLISQKRQELEGDKVVCIQSLRNLAKYPPALGMTGTVIGLVSLFSKLGTGDKMGIGPALGLAMTATFFGLILANAIILPLADRLQVKHLTTRRYYAETFQALCCIHKDEPFDLVRGQEEDRGAA